jgi:tRNA G46 methylase TrmB
MEICSGHGEWVVDQAKADPTSKWLAVELRHDRVFQTVARMYLEKVQNLSVIGPNDARLVLNERLSPSCIDSIFVNHPEPPERTGGSDDSDGSHLLNDAFFDSMCRVLKPYGTITIVTDNQPYAMSLAKTASERCDLECAQFLDRIHSQEVLSTVGSIDVYVGKPGAECGHVSSSSSSFFDRMWKHGKKVKRFTLFLSKV